MPTHPSFRRACLRCGRIRNINTSRDSIKTIICRDCRDADPEYVKAITTGATTWNSKSA